MKNNTMTRAVIATLLILLAACRGGTTTTISGTHDTGVLVESNTASALYPQIALDANGDAIAVWAQFDGAHYNYNIWAYRNQVTQKDLAFL